MTEPSSQSNPNQDSLNKRPSDARDNGEAFQDKIAGEGAPFDEEQFFIRLGQVDLFYKEYVQTEWDVGQTFGTHLQAFNNAYLAVSSAGRLQLFQKAYGYLQKAEAEWKWLQDNGPLRKKAAEIRESVVNPRRLADERQAEEYANSVWQEACQSQEEGEKRFEGGEFAIAIQRFSGAVSLFDKAGREALAEHIRQQEVAFAKAMSQKNFHACETVIQEMSALSPERVEGMQKSMMASKEATISEFKESILNNLNQRRFAEAEQTVHQLMDVDKEEGSKCETALEQAKDDYCKELERSAFEALKHSRFADAEQQVGMMVVVDSARADELNQIVQKQKMEFLHELGDSIDMNLRKNEFKIARYKVRDMAVVSEEEGRRWEGVIHICELEHAISEAIAADRFAEGEKKALDLSALDADKGRQKQEAVADAKRKRIEQLIEAIKADMEQGHFESAYEAVRKLSAIDEVEGRRWDGNVHVGELEHAISKAIGRHQYDEAAKTAAELSVLDEAKGREWAEKSLNAKRTQVEQLMTSIKADMEQGNFNSAYEMVRELSAIDAENGRCWEKNVHICEFEHAISEAIVGKHFAEGEKIALELSALDAEKGRQKQEAVAAAKRKQIEQLMTSIKADMEQGNFNSAYEMVQELSALDESEGKRWEKTVHICEFEHAISVAIAQHHYDEAGKVVAELSAVDEAKGREWAEKLRNAKAEHIRQLETSISEAIENGRFESARGTLSELAVMDADNAAGWGKKLRIHELSKSVSDAIAKMDFDTADSFVHELAVVDADVAGQLAGNVQAAKNARINELGRLVSEAIERNCFDDCGSPIEKIAQMDKGKAQEWKETVAKAKAEAIGRLETSVSDAVTRKDFALAYAAASKLTALNPEKGMRQEKVIHAQELMEAIAEAIEKKRFVQSEKLTGELASLDAEKGRGCERRIKAARAQELAGAIAEAIEKKRFALAEKQAGEMALLDAEKARGCKENIKAAKEQCIKELSEAVSTAESSGNMAKVDGLLEDLSSLDAEKARRIKEDILSRLRERVETALSEKRFDEAEKAAAKLDVLNSVESAECRMRIAKSKEKYCLQLEEMIKISLEGARFEDAEDSIQKLTLLDKRKGGEWKVAAQLRELECSFDEALATGSFDQANGKIQEMLVLDATKAAEMKQRLETVREERANRLERQIVEMIRYGALREAEAKLRMLESLDGEKAQKLGMLLDKAMKGKKTKRCIMVGVVVFVLIAIVFCVVSHLRHSSGLRKEAAMAAAAVVNEKDSALQEQADLYAVDALQKAMALQEQAQQDFENGRFAVAKDGYANAKEAFAVAGKAARKEHVLRIASGIENAIRHWQFEKAQTGIKELEPLDADKATELQAKLKAAEEEKKVRIKTFNLGNGVDLNLVNIKAGSFMRGESENVNMVKLTKDYWLGETEVTQGQYAAIMDGVTNEMGEKCDPRPSLFKGDERLPVERVSWYDAQAFCKRLNEKLAGELPVGYHFELPTEAQWEYAARGGNKSKGYVYSGGNRLEDVGWYYENSGKNRLDDKKWNEANLEPNDCKTHPVGTKGPNELGLYDMSGNVMEWCRDWYGAYPSEIVVDPVGPATGSVRVSRGGSWMIDANGCHVSIRMNNAPKERYGIIGFRVALVPTP